MTGTVSPTPHSRLHRHCCEHRAHLGQLAVVPPVQGGTNVGRADAALAREAWPVEEYRAGDDAVAEGERECGGHLEVVSFFAQVGPPRCIEEVVEGVELHGHQVLGRHAVGDLPGVSAVVGVEHAAVITHDDGLLAGVGAASAEATLVSAPWRGATVGRVADQPSVSHGVAVEVIVNAQPLAPLSALDTVDIVERGRSAAVLRLPLHLLGELGLLRDRVERLEDGARGDASLVRVHVEGRPLVDVEGTHLQAEDRLQVGVAVRGLVHDLTPVEGLLVGPLRLPLEQPFVSGELPGDVEARAGGEVRSEAEAAEEALVAHEEAEVVVPEEDIIDIACRPARHVHHAAVRVHVDRVHLDDGHLARVRVR
eukprot:scaffold3145_cov54-Phaeocystis_antarctica.AAC.1